MQYGECEEIKGSGVRAGLEMKELWALLNSQHSQVGSCKEAGGGDSQILKKPSRIEKKKKAKKKAGGKPN